jgi:hypothetical protein
VLILTYLQEGKRHRAIIQVSAFIFASMRINPASNDTSDTDKILTQVNFVHKALGKERATGQKAVKGPDHGNAPGPSRTAANRKTPAGADVEEISKILHMPTEGNEDEALKYFRCCNEILENPEARQKHYPKVEAFRRIRSWAGAIIPEEVAAEVKVNYSKVPTPNRPFQNIKGQLEVRDEFTHYWTP